MTRAPELIPAESTATSPAPEPRSAPTPLLRVLDLLNVALALVLVFFICLSPIYITDFFWQARTGELILRTGRIPTQDPFSWTAHGQPWQVHEWLTEVFFYVALAYLPKWVLLGYKCGLAAVTGALLLMRTWYRCGSLFWGIVAAVLAASVLRNYADLRPQMVSFVLISGLLLALEVYRNGGLPRLPWVLPFVFALWANLHGGVVVGLALLGIWVTAEAAGAWLFRERSHGLVPLALGAAACALAIAANPHGFAVYTYPFHVLGHPQVQDYIIEWYAPNFHDPGLRGFLILIVLTAAVLGAARQGLRGARWGDLAVIAAALYAALSHQRNTVLFALCAAPVTASGLASLWRETRPGVVAREWVAQPVFRHISALTVTVLLGVLIFRLRPPVPPRQWFDYGTDRKAFPESAVGFMKQGRWPGRLYNDYIWGGYLIWQLYPLRPVFIDGRAEVYYGTGAFDDEMTIHQIRDGWQGVLDRRGVEVVLTQSSGALAYALRRTPGWRLAFAGPVETVFTRESPSPGAH